MGKCLFAKKSGLNDEFQIADKITDIIDHYSKRERYSTIYTKGQNVKNNIDLKNEFERNIAFYKNNIDTYYPNYHQLFPEYFIKETD